MTRPMNAQTDPVRQESVSTPTCTRIKDGSRHSCSKDENPRSREEAAVAQQTERHSPLAVVDAFGEAWVAHDLESTLALISDPGCLAGDIRCYRLTFRDRRNHRRGRPGRTALVLQLGRRARTRCRHVQGARRQGGREALLREGVTMGQPNQSAAVDRFLAGIEAGDMPSDVFADDAALDATVPNWRFGSAPSSPAGSRIRATSSTCNALPSRAVSSWSSRFRGPRTGCRIGCTRRTSCGWSTTVSRRIRPFVGAVGRRT
jgi:hypothetical protein